MKRSLWIALGLLAVANVINAQDKSKNAPSLRRDAAPTRAAANTTTTQTPEMWLYEQERAAWENPKEAVRRKAESRGSQRANRIASMHWYGMSNSRPTANATPLTSTYSPTWTANNYDPFRWTTGRDTSSTTVIVR